MKCSLECEKKVHIKLPVIVLSMGFEYYHYGRSDTST